ncbi:nitrate reductase molybdenum cofactor assembly chaperone [Morganella morganii]|uniref:nitrate reductase molybdenum cofactor assembly chaperone n=1 Tax=Morganella morganii TaxID=582 RepID=UPI0032D9E710
MISLKIIGCLLDYPGEELWAHRDELIAEIEQAHELRLTQAAALMYFVAELTSEPLLDSQARYSELFDRGRATSLLLFEHVYGESRDRGQAMVSLLEQYEQAGITLSSRELPDYLPVYLEYLSVMPPEQACQGLKDIAPILALLGERLRQRESHYHELFSLLLAMADSDLTLSSLTRQVDGEARDDTPAALDAVWEEEQVTFLADKGCDNSVLTQHERRFSQSVAPNYIQVGDAPVPPAAKGVTP